MANIEYILDFDRYPLNNNDIIFNKFNTNNGINNINIKII